MKALFCGKCFDYTALAKNDLEPRSCACGNVTAWWVDGFRGIARVYAKDRTFARVIGMHNGFLAKAFDHVGRSGPVGEVIGDPKVSDAEWKAHHQAVCGAASGFLFHTSHRECWAVIIEIGQSNDVSWCEKQEHAPPGLILPHTEAPCPYCGHVNSMTAHGQVKYCPANDCWKPARSYWEGPSPSQPIAEWGKL